MADAERTGEAGSEEVEAVGSVDGGGWTRSGTAAVEVSGEEPQVVLLAGLQAVLALATGTPTGPGAADETAAPIQAEGADLAALFGEMAADLLDQVATLGRGFDEVRIDGLLETDDGGYSAWGYLLGSDDGGDVVAVALEGATTVEQDGSGRIALRATLRRA